MLPDSMPYGRAPAKWIDPRVDDVGPPPTPRRHLQGSQFIAKAKSSLIEARDKFKIVKKILQI